MNFVLGEITTLNITFKHNVENAVFFFQWYVYLAKRFKASKRKKKKQNAKKNDILTDFGRHMLIRRT